MKCKNKTDLGEGMELIQEDFFGWWKPRYYLDDDGFWMTNDVEVEIYGFIDRSGKVVSKFRHVAKNWGFLKEMRAEAEAVVNVRKG